ncbi:MAG: MBL fold metallo-hydrolase [Acidimicrobiia bacterium]|nr:MBL fold metallo-hydrolase [Acidimicrobiia bacterium]
MPRPGTTVTFYGVRGSTPCEGPAYERYGGHTSCVVLDAAGEDPLICDLGTGLRCFGEHLRHSGRTPGFRASVLLTHLHWDHVQGLPFFAPLEHPDSVVDVYGPGRPGGMLADVFAGLMRPPYFPIGPEDLAGSVHFHDAGVDDFSVGSARIRARWVRHTGPTLGYRVDRSGTSVAYVSDHGPGCRPDDPDDHVPAEILELCDGVDLLIHDSQHSCAEFEAKRHFGHSSVDYALHVAREAGVRTLVLFHHCPSHSDDDVDLLLRHTRRLAEARGGPEVIAAHEGMCLAIGSRVVDVSNRERPGPEVRSEGLLDLDLGARR